MRIDRRRTAAERGVRGQSERRVQVRRITCVCSRRKPWPDVQCNDARCSLRAIYNLVYQCYMV